MAQRKTVNDFADYDTILARLNQWGESDAQFGDFYAQVAAAFADLQAVVAVDVANAIASIEAKFDVIRRDGYNLGLVLDRLLMDSDPYFQALVRSVYGSIIIDDKAEAAANEGNVHLVALEPAVREVLLHGAFIEDEPEAVNPYLTPKDQTAIEGVVIEDDDLDLDEIEAALDLEEMTLKGLREYALAHDIDLGKAKKRDDILAIVQSAAISAALKPQEN